MIILFNNIFINKIKNMKKIIRLTESDLTRIVKRVIMEQTSTIDLFSDSSLTKSIGSYILDNKEHGMGQTFVNLSPTSNSMYKCLKTIYFSGWDTVPSSITTMQSPNCEVPKKIYTNKSGKNLIKDLA